MIPFRHEYASWEMNDHWLVVGNSAFGKTTAQFRPTRRNVIQALEKVYRDNRVEITPLHMWHKEKETT